jgi:imidazolonepropionase
VSAALAQKRPRPDLAPPRLFTGISELVQPATREGSDNAPLTVIRDASLLVADGHVIDAGSRTSVAARAPGAQPIDLGGRAVVPGFVDSHTHLVFAGNRVEEMARRARGESYEQIAKAGGGIARSAAQLAECTLESLVAQSLPRLRSMLRRGTTTCEIKSGYGLLPELEQKQLEAIAALCGRTAVDVRATLLAHSVPAAFRERRAEYLALFCERILPAAAQLDVVHCCDVFVETNVFTADEARLIAKAARQHDLGVKLHVDQLHDNGGAALAAELGALSADHLEEANAEGRAALAKAGVVATVLPGCRLFLGRGPWPAARALRDAGCEVAVATDCNPGTCMTTDLLLCATLAVTQCGLSLEEALWGITRGGAKALGLDDRGGLVPGERADFVVIDHQDWRTLLYFVGDAPLYAVYAGGELVG